MRVVATAFVWMSVSGDSLTDVGRGVDATGPWVTTHERTRWDAAPAEVGGKTSLVVYEVRGGLLRRAWFFPSLPLPGLASERSPTWNRKDWQGAARRRSTPSPAAPVHVYLQVACFLES